MASKLIYFGKKIIKPESVFLIQNNVFAMVNLMPVAPGHVLICSSRVVKRLNDLTESETLDLWMTAQKVSKVMEEIYLVNFIINRSINFN